jgi:hypothetical protein
MRSNHFKITADNQRLRYIIASAPTEELPSDPHCFKHTVRSGLCGHFSASDELPTLVRSFSGTQRADTFGNWIILTGVLPHVRPPPFGSLGVLHHPCSSDQISNLLHSRAFDIGDFRKGRSLEGDIWPRWQRIQFCMYRQNL